MNGTPVDVLKLGLNQMIFDRAFLQLTLRVLPANCNSTETISNRSPAYGRRAALLTRVRVKEMKERVVVVVVVVMLYNYIVFVVLVYIYIYIHTICIYIYIL